MRARQSTRSASRTAARHVDKARRRGGAEASRRTAYRRAFGRTRIAPHHAGTTFRCYRRRPCVVRAGHRGGRRPSSYGRTTGGADGSCNASRARPRIRTRSRTGRARLRTGRARRLAGRTSVGDEPLQRGEPPSHLDSSAVRRVGVRRPVQLRSDGTRRATIHRWDRIGLADGPLR